MRLIYRLHRWIALGLGALFVLIGLSGSLVVYQSELDRVLNPELLRGSGAAEPVSAEQALGAVEAVAGDDEAVTFLSLPSASQDVFRVYIGTPERIFDRLATVDPASGELMGIRPVGEGLMRFIHVLHFQLHLGSQGQTVVGLLGLCLLFSLLTGTLIWHRRRHTGRPAQTIHHGLGLYAGLPLLLVAVSGILLALPQYTRPMVETVSPLSGLDLHHHSLVADNGRDIGLEQAMDLAQATMPDGDVRSIGLPRGPEGVYRITVREGEAAGWLPGSGHVVLDRYSGKMLAERHWSDASGGDRFMTALRAIHGGNFLGGWGKALVALIGMLPLLLYLTGIRLWLRRRTIGQ
ncbi:PepSY-associated TM helix domain-containing protein [Gammaproteobacteria bacterium AB-CW1]|uniref:PepSY-associated TM helix domain-containing protein n=1 Tax=Natronospira elongata TaxID=3110268 RepID=A0AAP6JFI3_9GAMM|nr:PepSY-associated TM helix domain-containing protein [Gammaproteobacteria bacterium AB-CW1]